MPVPDLNPFPPEALEANRRGELSEAQRRGFGALSRYQRRKELSIAGFLVAGALLVGFLASPTSSQALRVFIVVACLAIAAFLIVRSFTGGDALARDLRQAQVQSVKGAIGKHRFSSGGGRTVSTYFLEVGDTRFKVTPAPYEAAPDAGFVRLYYLPHSRKVVNLERLADAPLQGEITTRGVLESLGAALFSPGQRERNEARAGVASMADALKARVSPSPATPPHARDPRPLGVAIVGTWTSGMMKVTFSAGGGVTTHVFGTERTGHWSVDAAGRLRADIRGRPETAEAWIAGDQLTISAEEGSLTFTREFGA